MRAPTKPFFHLPETSIEIILPQGTPPAAAMKAGGRAILAIKRLVARPVRVKVEARGTHTRLLLLDVETVPFAVDARSLLEKIGRAIEG
jgi:hypothetical protein